MSAKERRREPRWPPAVALLVLVLLPAVAPQRLTFDLRWLLPAVGSILLIAIIIVNPIRDSRAVTAVRVLTIALTVLLILIAGLMTLRLTLDLVRGGPSTANGSVLLSSGAIVWTYNNILFALLYWELDGGGPAARAEGKRLLRGLAFPQDINPQIAPSGWRPIFGDYLYLGLTNALAFSPTDVMPLAPWAKTTMGLQSVISFVVVGLVIARAVNILT
jgi:uncharacterized membrane protein